MKIQNKLIYSLLMITALMASYSCKDNFSEKDFLDQQQAASEEQKQALEEDLTTLAGFVLQLIDAQTGRGVPDLSVSLIAGDGTSPILATSDTDGNAKFADLPTGGYTLLVTGANYIDLSATIFFNDNSVTYVNGSPVVKRRNESARIIMTPTIESVGAGGLATIHGNVTAELDLTNTTPEIPQDLVVTVALPTVSAGGNNTGPNFGSLSPTSIALTQGYGTATIDNTTGAYSLQVPAIFNSVDLLFPAFVADQTIAYTKLNNVELDDPVLGTVETGFGGAYTYDAIPEVPGVRAVFPEPEPISGSGLKFTTSPTNPSSLQTMSTLNFYVGKEIWLEKNDPAHYQFSKCKFHVSDLGEGYQTSPAIEISGGGATVNATAYAGLAGLITSLETTGGVGYTPGDVTIRIYATGVDPEHILSMQDIEVAFFNYTITGTTLPLSFDLSNVNVQGISSYFETLVDGTYGYNIIGFTARVDGGAPPAKEAVFTVGRNCWLRGIKFVTGGEGYTSIPTLTFSGGGATRQAKVESDFYQTKLFIDVDNSNALAYNALPDISVQLFDGVETYNDNDIRYGNIGVGYVNLQEGSLSDRLAIDSEGKVVWKVPFYTHVINGLVTPDGVTVGVSPLPPARSAKASLGVNPNGEIETLDIMDEGYGYRDLFGVSIQPTFSSISGSGAEVQIDVSSDGGPGTFYEWTGDYTVIAGGSGYLENVNQQPFVGNPGALATVNNIAPGGEYVINWNYGTGETLVDVD